MNPTSEYTFGDSFYTVGNSSKSVLFHPERRQVTPPQAEHSFVRRQDYTTARRRNT